MAKIIGIAGMTPQEVSFEINQGGRFVIYKYCVSAFIATVTDSTHVYFLRAKESRIKKGLPWTLLTLLAGWWGFPFGPIRTLEVAWMNFRGGESVTALVANALGLPGINWADLD